MTNKRRIKSTILDLFTSPIKSFVLIALLFGTSIILIMPPFTGADEEAHFVRAYGISEGNLIIRKDEMVSMPTSFHETLGCLQTKQQSEGKMYQYTYDEYGKQKTKTLDCMLGESRGAASTQPTRTTAPSYSPTTYIPQTVAILFGKLVGAPIAIMDYLVRFAVLFAYIAMGALAIATLPARKWAVMGVLLMPLPILQITNPGGDYMLLGSVAVFIAGILRSRQAGYDNNKLLGLVVTAGALMVLPKGVFPGICFLPLLLFYGGVKSRILLKVALIVGILLLAIGWQTMSSTHLVADKEYASTSMLEFPATFAKTMFREWSNSDFLYGKSSRLGIDAHVGMPAIVITTMNILFAVYLFAGYPETGKRTQGTSSRAFNYLSLVVAVGVIVGTFAAMYVVGAYLRKGDGSIGGVQARYFYPAYVLLAAMLYKRIIVTPERYYRRIVLVGASFLLCVQSIMLAYMHHWV